MSITSNQLTAPVQFDFVTEIEDGKGGFDQVTVTFETRAHIRYLRGGETVQAARLQGRQPVVVTVRRSRKSMQIDADTVMRDVRSGAVYNIRAVVPTEDRQFIEITAESGVAV